MLLQIHTCLMKFSFFVYAASPSLTLTIYIEDLPRKPEAAKVKLSICFILAEESSALGSAI